MIFKQLWACFFPLLGNEALVELIYSLLLHNDPLYRAHRQKNGTLNLLYWNNFDKQPFWTDFQILGQTKSQRTWLFLLLTIRPPFSSQLFSYQSGDKYHLVGFGEKFQEKGSFSTLGKSLPHHLLPYEKCDTSKQTFSTFRFSTKYHLFNVKLICSELHNNSLHSG